MQWLKNKVLKWVHEDLDMVDNERSSVGLREDNRRPDQDPILTFRIYSAANGQVLEFRKWDAMHDRSDASVYVISPDEDIADYVSKCLPLEMLKL